MLIVPAINSRRFSLIPGLLSGSRRYARGEASIWVDCRTVRCVSSHSASMCVCVCVCVCVYVCANIANRIPLRVSATANPSCAAVSARRPFVSQSGKWSSVLYTHGMTRACWAFSRDCITLIRASLLSPRQSPPTSAFAYTKCEVIALQGERAAGEKRSRSPAGGCNVQLALVAICLVAARPHEPRGKHSASRRLFSARLMNDGTYLSAECPLGDREPARISLRKLQSKLPLSIHYRARVY